MTVAVRNCWRPEVAAHLQYADQAFAIHEVLEHTSAMIHGKRQTAGGHMSKRADDHMSKHASVAGELGWTHVMQNVSSEIIWQSVMPM